MFVDAVGIHEMSHQWWGNLVGWESYRDQWLSEGLASFSTAIALETSRGDLPLALGLGILLIVLAVLLNGAAHGVHHWTGEAHAG